MKRKPDWFDDLNLKAAKHLVKRGVIKDWKNMDFEPLEMLRLSNRFVKNGEITKYNDWEKVDGVKYYRCDISKAPKAKKQYRIRMAPTLIIFKDGINEESFKAGLDLECPVTLDELQEAIEDVKKAGQF